MIQIPLCEFGGRVPFQTLKTWPVEVLGLKSTIQVLIPNAHEMPPKVAIFKTFLRFLCQL